MTAYLDDPAAEFAALLGHEPAGTTDDLYAGLEPEDAFALVVHLAQGGKLGVPDDYEGVDTAQPDPDATRAPRPDPSQGRRHTRPERDPAVEFGNRIADAIDYPHARWRGIA